MDHSTECNLLGLSFVLLVKFLEDLIQSYSDLDMAKFADICFDMDNAVRFTFWELTMLRRLKRGLQVGVDARLCPFLVEVLFDDLNFGMPG